MGTGICRRSVTPFRHTCDDELALKPHSSRLTCDDELALEPLDHLGHVPVDQVAMTQLPLLLEPSANRG